MTQRFTHKYRAKSCEEDNIRFSSKAERAFYRSLKMKKQMGEVLFFLRQVPFHLPGSVKYIVDFVVFTSDGEVKFIDVKGVSTPVFEIKKKQVEALYPIKIEVVKMK